MKRLLLIALLSIAFSGAKAQAVLSVIDSTGGTTLDTVNANQAVAYDILIQNVGNQTFIGSISVVVAVQDSLGNPITFHVDSTAFANASIAPGAMVQGTLSHTISMAFYSNGNNITVIWPQSPNTNTVDTLYIPTYVLQSSGIAENDLTVSLYPNPTDGPLWIDVQGETVSRIEVYGLSGAIVARSTHSDTVDLSALPSGTYYLRLETSTGKTTGRMLIKR